MSPPSPPELLAALRDLPAAAPLLDRLSPQEPVYLVGGAVRDLMLGGAPNDLDLVVEGDAVALAERLGGGVREHGRFGTARAVVDGHSYDVAMARRERYPVPGALPQVEPATIDADLARRDFTVNAIALGLAGPRRGELIAVAHAFDDLAAQLLRVLHAASFEDDPTRLYRLARYAGRLRFAVERETRELVHAALAGGALDTVSGPRIGNELQLLAREEDPATALSTAHSLGIDEPLAPGFGLADPQLARRALAVLGCDGRRELLALAASAIAVPAEPLRALLDRLGFERADRERIAVSALGAGDAARRLARAERPSEIAAVLRAGPPELAALAAALGDERTAAAARRWLTELRHVQLSIDGGDLAAAGIPQGRQIGRGLQAALAARLDGVARGAEQELAVALAAARSSG